MVCEGALAGGGSIGVHGGLVDATMASSMAGGVARCTVAKVVVLAGAESQCAPLAAPWWWSWRASALEGAVSVACRRRQG
jgi:hypothetical protein